MNCPSSWLFPLALLLASCTPNPEETDFYGAWVQQDEDTPSQNSLDPDQEESIRSVVRRYKGQIKYCYDNRLAENPELEGRVEVYFALADGHTEDTQIVYNTTGDNELADCIRNKVQRWRFDSDIYADVIFPFILTL